MDDTVEAMASHRHYRPAMSIGTAMAEIKKFKGTLYDANVVDACIELFKSGGFSLQQDIRTYS